MKKLIALFLALCMALSMMATAYALEYTFDEDEQAGYPERQTPHYGNRVCAVPSKFVRLDSFPVYKEESKTGEYFPEHGVHRTYARQRHHSTEGSYRQDIVSTSGSERDSYKLCCSMA